MTFQPTPLRTSGARSGDSPAGAAAGEASSLAGGPDVLIRGGGPSTRSECRRERRSRAAVISISVIVPTFNRAQVLTSCLDALAVQTAPADSFEVIVVDDGSSDRTGEVISSFDPPFRLRAARQPNAGQPAALNHGIR